ncbi:MAG: sugar diacid recognition domain-containing protein [Pygmaiobacter sp.]|nr:sugar diacid recognition domain-containing protein [Pygmaiobacter sp.]
MYLSVQSAQQIALEISSIVKQHVNLMDDKGFIIASTDPLRIGHFHEGAKKIIDQHLPELYVEPKDETITTRTGINLPIRIDDTIVGVVGITGPYEQVFNYGQIVKKMTEILVREGLAQEQERLDNKIRNRFLEDWVLGNGLQSGAAFEERGARLQIDIRRPRRAVVLRIDGFQALSSTGEGQKRIELVEQRVRSFICEENTGNIFLRLPTKQVCLVVPRSDEQMLRLAAALVNLIEKSYGLALTVGIDDTPAGTEDVKSATARANKASHACRAGQTPIVLYRQISMELFMDDISPAVKREYLQKIFPGCGLETLRSWLHLLEVYFEAEGSIDLASEKLFMHKNTLQYKLKKLRALTGYDVRLPSNCAVFFIALSFFREIQNDPVLWNT